MGNGSVFICRYWLARHARQLHDLNLALLVVKKDTYRTVAWVNTNQGVRTEAETGDITNHRETVKI